MGRRAGREQGLRQSSRAQIAPWGCGAAGLLVMGASCDEQGGGESRNCNPTGGAGAPGPRQKTGGGGCMALCRKQSPATPLPTPPTFTLTNPLTLSVSSCAITSSSTTTSPAAGTIQDCKGRRCSIGKSWAGLCGREAFGPGACSAAPPGAGAASPGTPAAPACPPHGLHTWLLEDGCHGALGD